METGGITYLLYSKIMQKGICFLKIFYMSLKNILYLKPIWRNAVLFGNSGNSGDTLLNSLPDIKMRSDKAIWERRLN